MTNSMITLRHIREAFYATFAGAGELWFPYVGLTGVTKEEEESAVEMKWLEFKEELRRRVEAP